jgi:hypothetical protein
VAHMVPAGRLAFAGIPGDGDATGRPLVAMAIGRRKTPPVGPRQISHQVLEHTFDARR